VIVAAFYIAKRIVHKKISAENNNFFILLFRNFSGPVQVLFLLSALYTLLLNMPLRLQEQAWFGNLYSISVILMFGWAAARAVNLASDFFLRRFDLQTKDNLQARRMNTQVRVLRRLVTAIIIFVTLSVALMTFEEIRSLGVSLLASAGVAGIVIGLAAQKTIGNFFTGFQIAITQPIRLGDAVVAEGEWGWIEEINLTYVVVKIWDQRRLVLPISYFVDQPFQNWTRQTSDLLGPIVLYLDYSTPLEPLRNELTRILENEGSKLWDGKVNAVQVIDLTEKTMTVRALVSAADSSATWELRCLCRERLINFLLKNYPQSLPRQRTDFFEINDPGALEKQDANSS
jgi:small-conductance mechanosensitive channel